MVISDTKKKERGNGFMPNHTATRILWSKYNLHAILRIFSQIPEIQEDKHKSRGFYKLLFIRLLLCTKIQGTYFKISALYFKIYGLYFLQDALCFFSCPEEA